SLREQGVKDKALSTVVEHAEGEMDKCISAAVDALLKGTKLAPERKNEVRTHLFKSLWALAMRLDKGFNYDVRANDASAAENEAEKKNSTTINEIRKSIEINKI